MRPRTTRAWEAGALLVALLAAPVTAQNPVTWSASASTATVGRGDTLHVELAAEIADGWHLYALTQRPPPIAMRFTVPGGQPFVLTGNVDAPAPHTAFDQNLGIETAFYSAAVTFGLRVRVADDARVGAQAVAVQAYYQACTDQFCLPPRTVTMVASVDVREGAHAVPGRGAAGGAGGPERLGLPPQAALPSIPTAALPVTPGRDTPPAAAKSGPRQPTEPAGRGAGTRPVPAASPGAVPAAAPSLWPFLWLAMTVGALSLLTPCVFPMVPITVSYFTKHAAGSRRKAVQQALTYVAGIVLTFTALGMVMALLVGATSLNRFAANPWVNILITGIFLAFALSLFGVVDLALPSALANTLEALTRRRGNDTLATLLMGLTFTLTSFTCTAPFIGTLLVMAAGGDWQWPLAGLVAFSTVFALPFFVLALMPQWMALLPTSGGWLNSVKVLMAFLEVAAAMKFLSNVDLVWGWGVFTHDVVLATWVAIFVLMALYVLGLFRLAHDAPVRHVGIARLTTAVVCGTTAAWLMTGLVGKPLGELEAFLPPPASQAGGVAAQAGSVELPWILNDYAQALATARRDGKHVFIDFTGYTCTNCRWMEANMFPREDVRRQLAGFVLARLYTDGDGEIFDRQQRLQQEKYKTVALPFYAVVTADGEPIASFPGLTRDPAQFVAFLKQARSNPGRP